MIEINISEAINSKCNVKYSESFGYFISTADAEKLVKDILVQALALAAENAQVEWRGDEITNFVNRESILNTINQIK